MIRNAATPGQLPGIANLSLNTEAGRPELVASSLPIMAVIRDYEALGRIILGISVRP